jgi:hypothetical protein
MPRQRLQQVLEALHEELESTEELEREDRDALLGAMQEIREALHAGGRMSRPREGILSDRVVALVEDLESSHPKLAGLLRNLSESLANLGI